MKNKLINRNKKRILSIAEILFFSSVIFGTNIAFSKAPTSVYFQTTKGVTSLEENSTRNLMLHGLLFEAENPSAVLLVVHGLQSHSGWFFSGEELSDQGISVLAFDRRGSGLSEGVRGHVNKKSNFYEDIEAAVGFIQEKYPQLPLHLHANCFGTRSAVPFVENHFGLFKSMILTAPATAMRSKADYSLTEKTFCIFPSFISGNFVYSCKFMEGSSHQYLKSPLKDELFVGEDLQQEKYLKWINSDPYSIREMTLPFLFAVKSLDQDFDLLTGISNSMNFYERPYMIKTPTLVILGSKDKMVDNKKIRDNFFNLHLKNAATPVSKKSIKVQENKLIEFTCEHWLESCPQEELQRYRQEMIKWVLGR